MAFKLKNRVQANLGGGIKFKVWEITQLGAGANNISAEALGFTDIVAAAYTETISVTSAGTTAPAMATTYKGTAVVVTGATSGDSGTLKVWGS